MQELSTQALVEFDSEIRFKTLALKGDKERGLDLFAKLGSTFGESVKRVLIAPINC